MSLSVIRGFNQTIENALHSRCTVLSCVRIVNTDRKKILRADGCPNSPLIRWRCSTVQSCLSRRDGSAKWQARFKNGSRWIRVTTKEKNLKDAKEVARELYIDARYRVKHGIPAQSKRFKDVAKLAVDRMEKAMSAGEGKRVYRDYVQAINNYLIPFLGNHHVDHITYALI